MRSILLLCSLVACADKTTGDSGGPPPAHYDTSVDDEGCGDTPPVIDELWTEVGTATCETTTSPAVTVWATASDADWNLSSYRFEIAWDAVIDGSVTASFDNSLDSTGSVANEECGAPTATVGLTICINGAIPLETNHEWGAVISDFDGLSSEMVIVEGCTPTATGAEGC